MLEIIKGVSHCCNVQNFYNLRKITNFGQKFQIPVNTAYTAVNIPHIQEQFESQKIKHRHHPGKRIIKRAILPDELVKAAKKLLTDQNKSQLLADSKQLSDILKSRKLPVEKDEFRSFVQDVEAEVLSKKNVDTNSLNSIGDVEKEKIRNKVINLLRRRVHHWKPVHYDSYHSLLYIAQRLAPEYAALKQVFTELEHYDPGFNPENLFDFGSGIGSVSWAAHSLWGHCIKTYFCVDSSSDMISAAELLLQGGDANAEMFLKNVFFRQFLPVSHSVMYDLVVSSFSLMELTSAEDRLQAIDTLWRKCSKYLVIIDHGSNAGYSAIVEARDHVLKQTEETGVDKCSGSHVVAPCPHDFSCPRFQDGTKTPCNFEVSYQELALDQRMNMNSERFSYVILKKEPRSEESWPRIVREILPRKRHVVCRMCCPNGKLQEVIFTKYKHGRDLYRVARCSQWGDMIPARIIDAPKDNENTAKTEEFPKDNETTSETEELPHISRV